MKRPAVFLSLFVLSIVCSTVIITTAVSSICKSFFTKDVKESSVNVESTPTVTDNVINTSVNF